MSLENRILLRIMRCVSEAGLDAVVVGNAAAALQGASVMTQDIDLFIRETPRNEEKIKTLVERLGDDVHASRPFEPSSRTIRIEGLPVDIDLVFALSSRAKFESVKSRAVDIQIDGVTVRAAHLQDIIDAKRAAGRPKDHATLPILEDFLRCKNTMQELQDEDGEAE